MTLNPAWFQYPEFQWDKKHAIVIGGGIAGAQISWHLCQAGWKVTLIERHHKLANEASGNPAGVISPKMTAQESLGEDFYTQSFHYTLAQLKKLKQQGYKIKMDNCGVVQLTHHPREEKRWLALQKRELPKNFIQLLNEDETLAIAGIDFHSERQYKSCYFPKGGWIQPSSLVDALLEHPNCTVIKNTEALHLKQQLIKSKNIWQVHGKNNLLIEQSEVVIIANGKDLFSFEQSSFLPGMPVAGQTSSAPASSYSKQLKTVIGHEGYLTPAISLSKNTQANTHIFGATFDRENKNPELKDEANIQNFDNLKQYLPVFSNSLTKISSAHIAVRMTTPDRFPYVGALPNKTFYAKNYHDLHQGKQWKKYPQAEYQQGLFVLGGLGSRGIITSGFCAKALCDLLENKPKSKQTSQVLHNCHPARFMIKNMKRNIMK